MAQIVVIKHLVGLQRLQHVRMSVYDTGIKAIIAVGTIMIFTFYQLNLSITVFI